MGESNRVADARAQGGTAKPHERASRSWTEVRPMVGGRLGNELPNSSYSVPQDGGRLVNELTNSLRLAPMVASAEAVGCDRFSSSSAQPENEPVP